MRMLLVQLIHSAVLSALFHGISKEKAVFEWRALDTTLEERETPAWQPRNDSRLPAHAGRDDCAFAGLHDIKHDCSNETAGMGEALKPFNPTKLKMPTNRQRRCKYPDEIMLLPTRMRTKILKIWNKRDPHGDCQEQQRRIRLILLNLPPSLRRLVRPRALQCSLPHFIDRLESNLQVQLRRLWSNYKSGEPCSLIVAKQLRLLMQHDISLQSFEMPPATMFRRQELIQRLKRVSTM